MKKKGKKTEETEKSAVLTEQNPEKKETQKNEAAEGIAQEVAEEVAGEVPPKATEQVIEPLTGSSILMMSTSEEKSEEPDNGFPIGYGPNEGMKRKDPPKQPTKRERLSRSIQKLTKKQKKIVLTIGAFLIIGVAAVVVTGIVTGSFKIDYSSTYSVAKELRVEMQGLRSDASCSKVVDYVNNAYTSEQVYKAYVDNCKQVGAGIESEIVDTLGQTEGVKRDDNIRRKFETFSIAMDAAREGNTRVNTTLDLYITWHKWVIAENKGDNDNASWNWKESEIEEAASILTKSDNEDFVAYGEDWESYKKKAIKATDAFYHPAVDPGDPDGGFDLVAAREEMEKAQQEFTEWKKKNELRITKVLPLDMVDMAKLYDKFSSLYDTIKVTYQENYNYEVGGCKEMVGSVVCD